MKRKHLKRVVAGAFAAVMATSGISFPQANVHAEEKGNELRLWYDEPTSKGTNILVPVLGMIQTKKTDGSNIHCRLVMVIWERMFTEKLQVNI